MKKLLLIFSIALLCSACQKADTLSGTPDMVSQNAANKVPYTGLTYGSNGGGEVSLSPQTPYIGEPFHLAAFQTSGYEFDHWAKDGYITLDPEPRVDDTPTDNTPQDYLAVFVPLIPQPGVATVTFFNKVGHLDFLNKTQISYIGPDGKPHSENLGKIVAMRERFAVKKGTQIEIRVHLISKSSEPFYGCFKDNCGHNWDFSQTESEIGNSFYIMDVQGDVTATLYADPDSLD